MFFGERTTTPSTLGGRVRRTCMRSRSIVLSPGRRRLPVGLGRSSASSGGVDKRAGCPTTTSSPPLPREQKTTSIKIL